MNFDSDLYTVVGSISTSTINTWFPSRYRIVFIYTVSSLSLAMLRVFANSRTW